MYVYYTCSMCEIGERGRGETEREGGGGEIEGGRESGGERGGRDGGKEGERERGERLPFLCRWVWHFPYLVMTFGSSLSPHKSHFLIVL